tara:strand:- start:460 stop:582 length:123 start_codon:yes stop_codon:yes gene_type:complete
VLVQHTFQWAMMPEMEKTQVRLGMLQQVEELVVVIQVMLF